MFSEEQDLQLSELYYIIFQSRLFGSFTVFSDISQIMFVPLGGPVIIAIGKQH
jgi:hypothetical protein